MGGKPRFNIFVQQLGQPAALCAFSHRPQVDVVVIGHGQIAQGFVYQLAQPCQRKAHANHRAMALLGQIPQTTAA